MTSNFDFLKATLPQSFSDCARAESYLASDPRAACIYSRRAVEGLVTLLFGIMDLELPYRTDLAAMTNDPSFKVATGPAISQKLNLIRNLGNTAVHKHQPISTQVSLSVLKELHHVMVWAAFHHSASPHAVATDAVFDPKLAAQAAPITREQVVQLAAKFKAQDDAHAKEIASHDDLAKRRDAEIAKLRDEIKTAQQANTRIDHHDYTEAETRDLYVDVLLAEAGWPLTDDEDREYFVTGMPTATGTGLVDYVLWGTDGRPLAIVEAKRTSSSPLVGKEQAKLYADCLEKQYNRRPIIFYTNGYEHWIWDDAGGYPAREVQGFYNRDELELLIQRRDTRRPLSSTPVNTEIVERPYQLRAIKAIDDTFDRKQRAALLAMATGSGKTRTVIALAEQLMKANWAKRILFLADRNALVTQAAREFTAHLPDTTTVNLVKDKVTDARVYTSTYPTIMNLINETEDGVRRFSLGYFDLIIIDEAHRSVYAKYGAIFKWFDALLVGLTATPKDEVDHNTYTLFNLEPGIPTDAYPLDKAVQDGFLVPPRGVSISTRFLSDGIKYADLDDEDKDRWDLLDWGEEEIPDEIGAEELNRWLFNHATIDMVLSTLMTQGYKVAGGDRIGKTIIFAKNQRHAEIIAARFDSQYPEHAGHLARVITHTTAFSQNLIDGFSQTEKSPHIAISVDMLDTGIDVPDVVNLVFFKTVRSKSKFWQMIGRGTRLRPELFGPGDDKTDFRVFDFCRNFEFFGEDEPGFEGTVRKSLSQRLFDSRLSLIRCLDTANLEPGLRASTATALQQIVSGMNIDNFTVRPHRKWVERFTNEGAWKSLSAETAHDLTSHLSGLPSSAADNDEHAKRLDLIILRLQLANLNGETRTAERLRVAVQEIAAALLNKTAIPSIAENAVLLEAIASDEWWVDVTLSMLEHARLRLRTLAGFVDRTRRSPVYTNFEDELIDSAELNLLYATPGTDIQRFRAKAEAFLNKHKDHVAMQRLIRNKQLTPADLVALEEILIASQIGQQSELDRASEEFGGLGLFIRSLVGLERQAVSEAFGHYLDERNFDVDQIRFIDLIVDELTANGVMNHDRLFEPPFTDNAPIGPDKLFKPSDITAIIRILDEVKDHARPIDVA